MVIDDETGTESQMFLLTCLPDLLGGSSKVHNFLEHVTYIHPILNDILSNVDKLLLPMS